jgi:hypothetical protein
MQRLTSAEFDPSMLEHHYRNALVRILVSGRQNVKSPQLELLALLQKGRVVIFDPIYIFNPIYRSIGSDD